MCGGSGKARRLTRRLPAMLLALLLGLMTACSSDDPGPAPATSAQPSESSTPEVTATKPALPAGQPTAASAVAFVKYFWEAHNYAYATYDTSLLEAISRPGCLFCQSMISDVKRLKQSQTRVSGSEISLDGAALPPGEKIVDQAFVVAFSTQEPGTSIASNGKVTKVDGVRNSQVAIGLDLYRSRWLIRGVTIQKAGTVWPA